MIYADNAATTKLNNKAYEAMKPYFLEEYGNPSQPYSFSRTTKKALKESREIIASCIGASPEEIFFTSGGTESDNWVIKGNVIGSKEKKSVITSAIEHHAILHPCKVIAELGCPVTYMMPTEFGEITPEVLRKHISNSSQLVSIMFVNNEIGTIQPIKELCDITHSHGGLFHTDAVQAIGHININVRELGVDFLSASAHKFNGPRGVGFLYIHNGAYIAPFMHGGLQESGLRAGTENVALIVGMATALKENIDCLEENRQFINDLEKEFFDVLDSSGVDYYRNGVNQMPGIISLSFPSQNGEAILHRLDLKGICISTGSACDSQNTETSHVLKAIHLNNDLAEGTIRISFGCNNTKDEARIVAKELIKVVK